MREEIAVLSAKRPPNLTKPDKTKARSDSGPLDTCRNGLDKDGSDGTRTRDLRRDRPAF